MKNREPVFLISRDSLRDRTRNIIWGAGLSLALALLVTYGNFHYPKTYNEVLLWSVIGFVLLANLVNYYRHRRYLRRARDHRLEVCQGNIRFSSAGETSELKFKDIAAVVLYRGRGGLRHIQIRRKDNRGIRLEGYERMEELAEAITDQVPAAHVREGRG